STTIQSPSVVGAKRTRNGEGMMRPVDPPSERVKEKMRTDGLRAWFGKAEAIKGISLHLVERRVTAIIGPSGCGKSTFIRCLNRMHEVVPGARVEGRVLL